MTRKTQVTDENVRLAVDRLVSKKRKVTLRAIRAEIGSGSFQTIAKQLEMLGFKHTSKKIKPSDILPMSKKLSEAIMEYLIEEKDRATESEIFSNKLQDEYAYEMEQYEEKLASINNELNEKNIEIEKLKAKNNDLAEKNRFMHDDLATMQAKIDTANENKIRVELLYNVTQNQLSEKKYEIEKISGELDAWKEKFFQLKATLKTEIANRDETQ